MLARADGAFVGRTVGDAQELCARVAADAAVGRYAATPTLVMGAATSWSKRAFLAAQRCFTETGSMAG